MSLLFSAQLRVLRASAVKHWLSATCQASLPEYFSNFAIASSPNLARHSA